MKRIDELTSEPPAGLIFMKKGISMNIHPVIRVDISDKVGDGKVISDDLRFLLMYELVALKKFLLALEMKF